ncbi:MAG: SPOR domain-containing protein, partial [Pseudomonadota bacterium]
ATESVQASAGDSKLYGDDQAGPGALDSLLFSEEATARATPPEPEADDSPLRTAAEAEADDHDDVKDESADAPAESERKSRRRSVIGRNRPRRRVFRRRSEAPEAAAAGVEPSISPAAPSDDDGGFTDRLRAMRSEGREEPAARGFPAPIDVTLSRGKRQTNLSLGPMVQLGAAAVVLALLGGVALFSGGSDQGEAVAAFEARISDLEVALDSAEQQRAEAAAARDAAEEARASAMAELAEATAAVENARNLLPADRATPEQEIARAVEAAMADTETRLTTLENERDRLRAALTLAEQRVARAEEALDDRSASFNELREAFEDQSDALAAAETRIDQLQTASAAAALGARLNGQPVTEATGAVGAAPAPGGPPALTGSAVTFGATPSLSGPALVPPVGTASPSAGISTAGLGAGAPARPSLPSSTGPSIAALSTEPAGQPATAPAPASQPSSAVGLSAGGVPAPADRPADATAPADTLAAVTGAADAAEAATEDATASAGLRGVSGSRGDVYLQAGVFVAQSYGFRLRDNLIAEGIPAETLPTTFAGREAIRVRVGPLGDDESRTVALATLRSLGVFDAIPVSR